MATFVSLVFALLAFFTLGNAVQSLRARSLASGLVPPEELLRTQDALRRSAGLNGLVGLTFAAAAVLVWWSLPFALVLGGWPILVFAVMFATGNVDVISKLSSE